MARPPKSENALPWERQPGEGDKAFAAFVVYRDMGSERSTRKTAAALSKSNALIMQWSREHNWVERVASYDNDMDRRMREARNKEIEDMRKRHAQAGQVMLSKGIRALQYLDEERLKKLKPSDAAKLIEIGHKLEAVSRGEPDTITESRNAEQGGPNHGSLGELATDSDFIGAIQDALAAGKGDATGSGVS